MPRPELRHLHRIQAAISNQSKGCERRVAAACASSASPSSTCRWSRGTSGPRNPWDARRARGSRCSLSAACRDSQSSIQRNHAPDIADCTKYGQFDTRNTTAAVDRLPTGDGGRRIEGRLATSDSADTAIDSDGFGTPYPPHATTDAGYPGSATGNTGTRNVRPDRCWHRNAGGTGTWHRSSGTRSSDAVGPPSDTTSCGACRIWRSRRT